jgi:hypothetical protein
MRFANYTPNLLMKRNSGHRLRSLCSGTCYATHFDFSSFLLPLWCSWQCSSNGRGLLAAAHCSVHKLRNSLIDTPRTRRKLNSSHFCFSAWLHEGNAILLYKWANGLTSSPYLEAFSKKYNALVSLISAHFLSNTAECSFPRTYRSHI